MHPEPSPARVKSPLLFIFLTVFIDLLGFGIVIPLLPTYSLKFQSSELELGLLFSCFSGMQFVFAPMWGRLSDRIGRRPVLIGGLIGTSASYVLFAHASSMQMLYASRLLAGFFGANVSAAQAYIADVTKPEQRAKGMGLVGAAFGLGFTLGPLFSAELTRIGERAPGYAAAALSLAAAIFGALTLAEPARHASDAARAFGMGEVREALRTPRIGTLLLLNYLAIFAFSCFESMFIRFGLALFPSVFHFDQAVARASVDEILRASRYANYYLCFIGVISAVIQGGFIRRLVPRFGETRLVSVGPLVLGLGLLLIGLAPSWPVVIAGCILMPFGFGLNNPSLAGLTSRAAPPHRQGAYLGMSQSAASLARVTGPPIAGVLFARIGPHSPFVAAACVLFVAALIAVGYRARFQPTFEGAAAAPPPPPQIVE